MSLLLEEYYNSRDEEKRLLPQHGQVEYLTTMKYIHECISQMDSPIFWKSVPVRVYTV